MLYRTVAGYDANFADVTGQDHIKRTLEVAAVESHDRLTSFVR